MLPILIITCSVTSEEYSSHSSTRALLSVHCVEAVDKLVEVVGRLHDGAQESDESHIVALGKELGSVQDLRSHHDKDMEIPRYLPTLAPVEVLARPTSRQALNAPGPESWSSTQNMLPSTLV